MVQTSKIVASLFTPNLMVLFMEEIIRNPASFPTWDGAKPL